MTFEGEANLAPTYVLNLLIHLLTRMKSSLLIAQFFPPDFGGIQNYLYNICKNLPKDKIFVMAAKDLKAVSDFRQDSRIDLESQRKLETIVHDFDQTQPFKIYRTKFKSLLSIFHLTPFSLYRKARKICKKEKIEMILLGHFYIPSAIAAIYLKKVKNIPYVLFTYGLEITETKNNKKSYFILKSCLKNAKNIIVITEYLKRKIAKDYLGSIEKIIKIPPGVDFNFFKPGLQVDDLHKKLNLQNQKIILTCGRLVRRKNHQAIISVMPKILKEIKNVSYVIVGDGPEKESLVTKVKALSLQNHVKFLDKVLDSELPYYYNLCDVFCLPSIEIPGKGDVEGFGIVFLEALACGKPVVGGNSGGIHEAVSDNVDGFLVDPKNLDALSMVLIKILKNQNLAKKMGRAGREKVIAKHDWGKLVEKLKMLLN
jgi:phosphatidylinositol alpha-1,6-mannosyltransferase